MSADVRCATCVFWRPENASGFLGRCRRMPPTIQTTVQGAKSMWPITAAQDWCGEHGLPAADAP